MTERPVKPFPPLAKILDRLLEQAMQNESPSFRDLTKSAALDPARDFVGASLREVDFRDEDLRGFDFSNADLTGADFRRANVQGVHFERAILDGAIGLPMPLPRNELQIFISYRSIDNDPPPDAPNRGFVDYLLRQVRFDLTQLGVANQIVWQDRTQIAPADDFSDEISNALNKADLFIVILSKNYVTSSWCAKELDTMTARATAKEHRIFRVDKHKVPDDEVPVPLRRIESVQFYREDRYANRVDDYFWRGKVVFIDEYEGAVKKLAVGISNRLDALGFTARPRAEERDL